MRGSISGFVQLQFNVSPVAQLLQPFLIRLIGLAIAQRLARGASADDVIGNRIYASWGVGDNGVHTTIDRKKLLPVAYGGSWVPATMKTSVRRRSIASSMPASPCC